MPSHTWTEHGPLGMRLAKAKHSEHIIVEKVKDARLQTIRRGMIVAEVNGIPTHGKSFEVPGRGLLPGLKPQVPECGRLHPQSLPASHYRF